MIFYISFFIFTSFSILFINRNMNLIPKITFLLSCVLLFSLRDFSVGSDTFSYYEIFYSSGTILPLNFKIEPLFLIFNNFIYHIYPNFIFYLFIFSILFFSLWIENIERIVAYNKDVAYISFISFFGLLLSFNIARQSLAMSFCVLSLYYLLKNKNIVFFLLVITASLIHYSAILFIVSFFLFRFAKYPFFILLSTFLSCYLILAVSIRFFSVLSIRYVGYTETGNSITGAFLILFIAMQYILFYYTYRKNLFLDDRYSKLFSVFSFGVGLFLALKVLKFPDEGPVRLSFYFLIVNILLFPYFFKIFKNGIQLIIAKYLFYLFCCFYFFWVVNTGAGGISNYFLNRDIVIF